MAFMPQEVQVSERQASLPAWQETVPQLTVPAIPKRAALSSAEQIQIALCQISNRYNGQLKADNMGAQATTKAPAPMAAGEQHCKPPRRLGSIAPAQNREAGAGSCRHANGQRGAGAGKGVFQRPRKKPRMAMEPAQSSVQGAAFFMGLQQGRHDSASSEASDCSDDSLAAG